MSGTTKAGPIDRFLSAFTLVSRIPVRIPFIYDPRKMDWHLPLVALPVAVSGAAVLYACVAIRLPPFFAALGAFAWQYFAFNLFHLDGLMDSADAMLGVGDKEKRLAILKDSRIGVYAFFAGSLNLACKTALWYRLAQIVRAASEGQHGIAAIVGLFFFPIAGRSAAALIPALVRPARPDGLGAQTAGATVYRAMGGTLMALLPGAFIALAATLPTGAARLATLAIVLSCAGAVFVVAAAVAVFVARSYRNKVGGYTGDALGAAVEIAEAAHLGVCLWLFAALR